MALAPTKNNPKSYGTIKSDTANNITKIYYSNKPDYLSSKTYQRLPESPSSSDSMKRFANGSSNKKITLIRSSPGAQQQQQQFREGSASSGSNSRSSPKPSDVQYQQLARSRTITPPKYLSLTPMQGGKLNFISNSNNSSPTKQNLPSSSVLYHQTQVNNADWKQQHQRANSGRSNSGSGGENKYRIQF